jgi:hypothetical protein
MGQCVHHIPGRLRVKSPRLKRNEAEAARARALLAGLEGVMAAEVNTVTGSLLIGYDPLRSNADRLVRVLAEHGIVRDVSPPMPSAEPPDRISRVAEDATGALGKLVVGMLVEKLVERSALALVAAVL